MIPYVPAFKVTQGHWNRHGLISYLWLPVSASAKPWYTSNDLPWSSVARWAYLVPFSRYLAIFTKFSRPPCIKRLHWRGSAWNLAW